MKRGFKGGDRGFRCRSACVLRPFRAGNRPLKSAISALMRPPTDPSRRGQTRLVGTREGRGSGHSSRLDCAALVPLPRRASAGGSGSGGRMPPLSRYEEAELLRKGVLDCRDIEAAAKRMRGYFTRGGRFMV